MGTEPLTKDDDAPLMASASSVPILHSLAHMSVMVCSTCIQEVEQRMNRMVMEKEVQLFGS